MTRRRSRQYAPRRRKLQGVFCSRHVDLEKCYELVILGKLENRAATQGLYRRIVGMAVAMYRVERMVVLAGSEYYSKLTRRRRRLDRNIVRSCRDTTRAGVAALRLTLVDVDERRFHVHAFLLASNSEATCTSV